MKATLFFLPWLLSAGFALESRAKALRAADLTEAKEMLSSGKASCAAVFLHGSDWCPAGEFIKENAWDSPALAASLPPELVMVAVDHPEERVKKLADRIKTRLLIRKALPLNPILPIAKNGTRFALRKDGSWQASKGSPNPSQEVLRIPFRVATRVSLIRLKALTDAALPANGPGRARNGNCVITELQVRSAGKLVPLKASASYSHPNAPASQVADGDLSPKNGWNIIARHGTHSLWIVPDTPLDPGSNHEITIHCLSRHRHHTLGRFRLDAFHDKKAYETLLSLSSLETLHKRNKALPVSSRNYPALILLDVRGRPFAQRHGLAKSLAAPELAKTVREGIRARETFAELLASAEKAEVQVKIERLARAWLLMEKHGMAGHYRELPKKLLQLDPRRESPWTWRVAPGFREIAKEEARIRKEQGEQAALNYLDTLLKDPRLKLLNSSQRQQLLLRKFHIYRSWKGHQKKRFAIMREIITTDPSTHLGIGAKGYIDLHSNGDPSIALGWKPAHLKDGKQTLVIREGVDISFPRSGPYRVTLATRSSKAPLAVSSVALFSGNRKISADSHPGTLMHRNDKDASYELLLPEGLSPRTLSLHITLAAPPGHAHRSHRINIQSLLPANGKFGWK